jgi:pyruvate formate-lyase activating enzyme-like uncharacterized protein
MVLLITGRCLTGCFYCPLSMRKKGKDVVFANELLVKDESDILEEAGLIEAEGTGITGGDPLWELERTVEIIKLLKNAFGDSHHIHLYTSTIDADSYLRLEEAGLDEIRVHPPLALWNRMETSELGSIRRSIDMNIGLEVPVIPDEEGGLTSLMRYADGIGLDFVNLNELEFSETNCDALLERGFEVKHDISSAVEALLLLQLQGQDPAQKKDNEAGRERGPSPRLDNGRWNAVQGGHRVPGPGRGDQPAGRRV